MSRYLLDVNVLVALVWPRHEMHAAAHTWFSKSGNKSWATSPLSQLGVLRLLTNPAVTQGAVKAHTALDVLHALTRHPGHEFWPLDQEMPTLLQSLATRLYGHKQWTDAALLRHAAGRGGVLATFDAGFKELAGKDLHTHLLVLKAS